MKLLIMCEGPNELKIINILLENQKLKFTSDDLLGLVPYHARQIKSSAAVKAALNLYPDEVHVLRIGDGQNEKLEIPSAYKDKITLVEKYCTKPELEMLLIISEDLADEYEKVKSKTKPKTFAKANIRCGKRRYDNSTAFYEEYFGQNCEKLVAAIKAYAHTGNQIMVINTLFQLLALREQDPELLQKAAQILFMPDLFAALLGAEPVCERSIASTSQMLDPRTGQWSREVLAAYGLPENRFAPIVSSGTVTGTLANGAKIIAVAGHDTQCASAAMPCAEEDAEHTAFLSCGTWSLLGTELEAPILTADSCQSGLSNELGANGKINYLKNIIGLWLIQESRREYKRRGQAYSFAELEQQALAAEPLRSFIDPDAPEFVAPGDLPGRIQEFCRKTGQPVPETVGAVMRCIYESLALKYRYAIEQLSAVTGRAFTTLHVLGGGTKDRLLCQMTADCCGLTVKAGPVEATALGNIMIQLKALGLLDSITQGRRLIAETEVIKTYTPSTQNYAEWNAAYDRFKTLL